MKITCPLENRPKWCQKQCRRKCKEDPQKTRLYCFEESLVDHIKGRKILSLSRCKEIVEEVCNYYQTAFPLIKDGRGLKSARGGYSSRGVLNIKLPRQYRYRLAVLHEAAHCVMQYKLKDSKESFPHHGSLYMKYLLEIYSKFMNIPHDVLLTAAKEFNLKVDE